MKNTPITARVKSGMFKTKEPLLNVGPAGVDGNNKTRTMPSPSKMKGYSMKSSPFKDLTEAEKSAQSENKKTLQSGENNSGVSSQSTQIVKTAGDIVKGKEITKKVNTDDYDGSGGYASDEDWNKFLATDAGKRYTDKNTKEVGTGTFEPDTVGPDKETKVKTNTDLYRKSTGKAQSAYDRRNNFRANTRANRGVNKNERKLGKYGSFNAAGDFTPKDNLSQRELRKMRGAKSKLEFAKQEVKNTNNQSKQNVGGFSKANVRNDDQRATMGDFDLKTEQPNMSTLPGKSKGKSNPFSNVNTSPNTEIGFTPAEQKLSKGGGLFKKAGPLKKGYFK
jgi:hypothetical protein